MKSKTRHGVHSPFVYKLIEDVIYDKKHYSDYGQVEAIRDQWLGNHTEIKVTDLGAGSRRLGRANRKLSSIARSSVKPKKYGQLLFRLVKYLKPETILELGTSLGITTLYLAKANPGANIYTIEGCPEIAGKAKVSFKTASAKNISLLTGDFGPKLETFLKDIETLDFVYFDGNHTKDATQAYFSTCLEKSNNNSIFIFDDIHWSAGMEEAWKEIKQHPKVKVTLDLFYMGLVFFRKEQPKEHFCIRF